jgi:ArsR family transcriptional regulator, arsenate/arsenite/antimonite-responsive transcriptional repressor
MTTTMQRSGTASGFRALGDATRVRILELLARGEQCVCNLTDAIDVPQPLLSHHLKILREAGFIRARKDGRWSYYALNPERLETCVGALEAALATYDESARKGKPGCACRTATER